MKKLLSILLVGVLALGIMGGCSKVEEKKEEVVESVEKTASAADVTMFLSLLSRADIKTVKTMAHNEVTYDDTAILLDETVSQQEFMALVYPLISGVTNSETVANGEVIVNTDITAINMDTVLTKTVEAAEIEPSLVGFTKEQIQAIDMVNFQAALDAEKANLVTTNLDITVKMVDGSPLIVMDDAFMSAIMGGSTELKIGFEENPTA